MHQAVIGCHGTAGPAFIGKLVATKAEWIKERFGRMVDVLRKTEGGSDGAHLQSVAVTALADALADWWIFGDGAGADIPARSWDRAAKMGAAILSEQANLSKADVNANATQCIVDWVMSNREFFTDSARGTRLGCIDGNIAYIFPSLLNQMLERVGYSPRKTIQYLAGKGYIQTTKEANKKERYQVKKRLPGGKPLWFVALDLDKAQELNPNIESNQNVMLGVNGSGVNDFSNSESGDSGFTKMDPKDDNPFEKYEQKPLPF